MADVYWNLHKDCFSVKVAGRPVFHVESIVLRDARFVVQRGGWERTVRERCKRVHAMVRGEIVPAPQMSERGDVAVTYNPYVAPYFRERMSERRIDAASMVWFSIVDGKPVVEVM